MELFFDMLRSIVYGVIEGITEWLPISSTGHMILAERSRSKNNSISGKPPYLLPTIIP